MEQERQRSIEELETLSRQWGSAELNGDTEFLGKRLTDDFVGIGPLGFMLTKAQWLARYTGGGLRYDTFALEEARVRPYGDAAIVTGRQVQSGSFQGHDLPTGGRVSLVWVRQGGRWLLAGWQMSPIAEPPVR